MEIYYSYENLNWVILAVGAVIIVHMLVLKKSRERVIVFANYETLKKVVGHEILQRNLLPLTFRILAVICILLAISNLRVTIVKPVSDVDFVIAIDTSPTMLTSDNGSFTPSRLEAAKYSAIQIVDVLPKTTYVGVVSFAGKAFVKSELTNDKKELKNVIESIKLEGIAGTAIGDAILSSTLLLANSNKTKKVVVLITDGTSNTGMDVNESVRYAKSYNVRINTIGVGKRNRTINITMEGLNISSLLKENATFYTGDYLDEETLKNVANQTGGRYFYVNDTKSMLEAFKESVLKANAININVRKYAVVLAFIFLMIEWALGATKYRTIP